QARNTAVRQPVVSGAHGAGPDVFGGMVAHLRLVHRGSVDPAPAAASGRPGGGVDRKRPAADVGGAGRARRGRLQRLAQNGAPHAAGAAGPGGRRPRHLVAPQAAAPEQCTSPGNDGLFYFVTAVSEAGLESLWSPPVDACALL